MIFAIQNIITLITLECARSTFLVKTAQTAFSALQQAASVQGQLDQSNPGKMDQT